MLIQYAKLVFIPSTPFLKHVDLTPLNLRKFKLVAVRGLIISYFDLISLLLYTYSLSYVIAHEKMLCHWCVHSSLSIYKCSGHLMNEKFIYLLILFLGHEKITSMCSMHTGYTNNWSPNRRMWHVSILRVFVA